MNKCCVSRELEDGVEAEKVFLQKTDVALNSLKLDNKFSRKVLWQYSDGPRDAHYKRLHVST